MPRRPLNFYNEIDIKRGTLPPFKSKRPAVDNLPPFICNYRIPAPQPFSREFNTRSKARARDPSSNDANYQTTAKRRRNTIEHSSNSDVDYNDNNDYGSPIRFPRRVSPVLPSTSFMSLSTDPNDDIDVPEDGQNHTPDTSHSPSYQASPYTSSNLSISSTEATNFGDSFDIHDNVHYSIDSETSQLKQHDNHEVQEAIQCDLSAEASHPFQHDPTKSLPPNKNMMHCERPSWALVSDDESMNISKPLEPKFSDDDTDESSLSDFKEDDASSGYSSAEGDDDEYENIKGYYYRILGNPVAAKGERCIYVTHELMVKFWEDVIDLKETRKNIIKELKGKLKKPRNFSDEDINYFKENISLIELRLNKFIPTLSKLRATFIRGSNKNQVLFKGYKYSRSRQEPTRFKCTYNADPDTKEFDYSLDKCLGYLELDEKGYLQPGTYIRHFHDPVKNGDFDQNLAEPVLANFDNVTRKCENITNHKKFNHFLDEKLQQVIKYNEDAVEIKSREQVIEDQLEKLKLLNDSYKEEENYIPSFVQWVEFFRIHVRIGDVRKLNKSVLQRRNNLVAESTNITLESNEVVRQRGLDILDIIEKDKRFDICKNKWWAIPKEGFDRSKKNVKDIMDICVKFMETHAEMRKTVGRGGFGKVRRMFFKGFDTEFVEKVVSKIDHVNAAISEAEAYVICDEHEYIPKMIYNGYNADGKWCIVLEYINGGTLIHHIENSIISEKGKQTIAFQLALALEYLHENNLTHGDLKPNNVALTLTGHVRLFDFGQSRNITLDETLPFSVLMYSAPEVALKKPAGLAADRFSYGVVIAYLMLRRHPLNYIEMKEFMRKKTYGQPNLEGIHDEAAEELIKGLLQHDPNDRPKNISKHRYFNGVDEKDPPFKPMNRLMAGDACGRTNVLSNNHVIKKFRKYADKFVDRKCYSNDFVEIHPTLQYMSLCIPSKAYLNTFKKRPGGGGDACD